MTNHELLLRMKGVLERMFDSEDEKHHVRIQLALSLVLGEISKVEPEIVDTTMIVGILLEPVFKENKLPPFQFDSENIVT
jgi:hypothetical protein